MAERRLGPDQLRAILLATVIFGHTIAASVSEDLTKWVIYSFHMPLFLALSGSLLSVERISSRSISATLRHYAHRLGWQWLLVTVLFMAVRDRWPINLSQVVTRVFTDPYFHLWYVPALVFMVVLTWTLGRLRLGMAFVIGVGAIGWLLFDALQIQYESALFHSKNVDYRFIGFYLWFGLGMASARGLLRWFEKVAPLLVVVGILGVVVSFPASDWIRDVSVLMLNLGLITQLPLFFTWLERPLPVVGSSLVVIGKYSLWIYLLHPLATGLLKDNPDGPLSNVLGGVALTIAILLVAAVCGFTFDRIRKPTTRAAST